MNDDLNDQIERMITTHMSAHIVADLLRAGTTVAEMAQAVRAPEDYIRRVQRKLHSFTFKDVRRLSRLANTTPQLLLFNAIRPVRAEVKPLFDATRRTLELSAALLTERASNKGARKRGRRTRAA